MSEVPVSIYISTKIFADLLTDEELNAITMVAIMDANPVHTIGYEKVEPLFQSNGTMHALTKDALVLIHNERFGMERHVDETLDT